ncbi:protein-L-isoaspartate(D-aspartate) O-methyltransferase [Sediminicola sp. 1XM1-17]|uniref:protein-L-isoaspartate(D-aspartate) O-methyltransferase n=1 Tax=Sediminicola sp. 1XM1-17 TaxID=3127702 RepID=UPI003076D853
MILSSLLLLFSNYKSNQDNYWAAREEMVKTQLQGRGITDPATLYAMLNVPRQEFVPEHLKQFAYMDRALPIGHGQTISQPYLVAFMTQTLGLRSSHNVLEIGTGSGYQAAVLSKIVDSVHTIEIVRALASSAGKKLADLGYSNINVKAGDGYHGWPSKAPFDAIMVTAGADTIPQPLIDQLKNGGKMVIPIGPAGGVRQLQLVVKKNDRIVTKNLLAVRFVPFTRDEKN